MLDQKPFPSPSETTVPETDLGEKRPELSLSLEQISPSSVESQEGVETTSEASSNAPILETETAETGEVLQEELAEITSSEVDAADISWVNEVKKVIREDKDQPYQEQVDAEKLNEAYLRQNFGVKIEEEDK